MALQQVKVEEQQRIIGFIPNFYVTYDKQAVPLTPKLKFYLAMKVLTDPVTIAGYGLNAAFYQMGGYPSYRQGAIGYGQRLGATFAGDYTNAIVGNAVLPSLLHQNVRYFYQGTGTTKSRLLHALSGEKHIVQFLPPLFPPINSRFCALPPSQMGITERNWPNLPEGRVDVRKSAA